MKIIKKLFGKKEVETTEKVKPVKKQKTAKPRTGPNGKEAYRIEKAKRQLESQKQREKQAKVDEEKLVVEEQKRAEENKIAEAIRQEKLDIARAENKKAHDAKIKVAQKEEAKLELFGYDIDTLKKGDVIEVEILESDRENYLVRSTTNFQEAKLPKVELDGELVKIGDKITVLVWKLYAEETFVSLRRYNNKENLKTQMSEIKEKTQMSGTVVSFKSPNFMVRLDNGLQGKVYIKNIDTIFVKDEDAEKYIDQKFEFLVVKKFDNAKVGQTQFELSRRDLLNGEQEEFVNNLSIDQTLEIEEYTFNKGGLEFFHNGIRGFIPISELSHKYISSMEEIEKEIKGSQKLIITEIKKHKGQFNIIGSIKKTTKVPFDVFVENYGVNSITKGKITKIETYGLFVEISPEVRGLLHKSEFSQ
ncbi:MAG: S1 RNA-binding domain-containing protein, partial [Mycoplasmatales bacterium]